MGELNRPLDTGSVTTTSSRNLVWKFSAEVNGLCAHPAREGRDEYTFPSGDLKLGQGGGTHTRNRLRVNAKRDAGLPENPARRFFQPIRMGDGQLA